MAHRDRIVIRGSLGSFKHDGYSVERWVPIRWLYEWNEACRTGNLRRDNTGRPYLRVSLWWTEGE